ncbi:MAG TPA: hypothetical protein VF796_27355 [Humisphaera sp.]
MPRKLTGEVVYLYAFDVAYEMSRQPVRTLMGHTVAEFHLDTSKRAPRQHTFYRPQMVRLTPLERLTARGPLRLERSVKILPVGAISITVRVPFEADSLDELIAFHDLRFTDGSHLYDEVRRLANDVRKELAPHLVRPVEELRDEEAYTVFCLKGPLPGTDGTALRCEDWLATNRRSVAALLTEEPDPTYLSDQEAEESTGRWLSYYERDILVADWDAAILIDEPRYWDEVLYLIELANIQLAELEAYDRLLDQAVERSYRDVANKRWSTFRNVRIPPDLRELRIDLSRLSDELQNITKFFGDWHMARIYQSVSTRFHLADWHRSVDDKLKTLDELYQLLRGEQNNRWMLVLEVSIVVLFVADLVLLGMTAH